MAEERAMDSSWAWAPLMKPPPGFVADAKLSTPTLRGGVEEGDEEVEADEESVHAASSVEISRTDTSAHLRDGDPVLRSCHFASSESGP